MLHVYRSNRIEALAHALAARLHTSPLSDPMACEQVVVATHGMAQWLSQRLSHHLGGTPGAVDGICANIIYPFPRQVVDTVLDACLDSDHDQPDPWSPDRLTWTLLRELPALLDDDAFSQLRAYLGGEPLGAGHEVVGRRAFGLARRLADVLDQYALMRPDMVGAWSRNELAGPVPGQPLPAASRWQPALWQRVAHALGRPALSERFRLAMARLAQTESPPPTLPPRLSLFGLSALPPAFLELLGAASQHVPVDLYLLCPSAAFWSDIQARRDQLRRCTGLLDPADIALREGNPVLASFGRLGRDFQVALERLGDQPYALQGAELFVDPERLARDRARAPTMLELLQADILHLRNRGAPGAQHPSRVPIPASDASIRVHACHGAIRQVEVLRDTLLRLMNDHSSIEPRDILVMTPDIERFAPLVAAVFADGCPSAGMPEEGWGPSGAPELPFQVTDRSLRETNPVAGALMRILEMVPERVPASAVLDLLAFEPVRQRFELGDDDLTLVQRWVRESGIRWGIDAEHRAAHDQPRDDTNSWRFGLDRLLLGAAMPDEAGRAFGGTVPFDDVEGSTVEVLGKFVHCCEDLFDELRRLAHPRRLAAWVDALHGTVARMTATSGATAWLGQQVREALDALGELDGDDAGEGEPRPVTVEVIRALLDGGFEVGRGRFGHETGAITFSAMVPMRSVPHKVIALLGMDDGAFPRNPGRQGFDLMAEAPRVGDRDPREEDRFILLEAVLAARKHLIVTYAGRDVRTNEPLPPAVPIAELLDMLCVAFEAEAGERSLREQLVVEHPLQAFSPRNFGVPRAGEPAAVRSFDCRLQLAAQRVLEPKAPAPREFFLGPLDTLSEELAIDDDLVPLEELVRFLMHPIEYLLTRGLGIRLKEEFEQVQDREPVALQALEQWQLGQRMLDERLAGRASGAWEATVLRRGALPPGTPGQLALATTQQLVQGITDERERWRDGPVRDVLVDLPVGGRRLVGKVRHVFGDHQLVAQYGKLRPKHRLELWVRHLALQATEPERASASLLVARDPKSDKPAMRRFEALGSEREVRATEATEHMASLLSLWERGRREPLPLFPRCSEAYVQKLRSEPDKPWQAVQAASRLWEGDERRSNGDRHDPYVQQAYGVDVPFEQIMQDTDFPQVAQAVWGPLLDREGRP